MALRSDLGNPVDGSARKLLPQLRAGIDKRSARHVEAHHLHHHLVGIGGAVKCAGARGMIGGALGFEQFVMPDLSFGEELADARLFPVWQS